MTFKKLKCLMSAEVTRKFNCSSLCLALAIFCFIFTLYYNFILHASPDYPAWKIEELRRKYVLNGSLADLVPLNFMSKNQNKMKRNAKIAIVIIVTKDTKPEAYDISIQTIRCYCKIHNYEFVYALDSDFNCPHKDLFFRRHCAVAKILPLFDAILFIDADIGVVNPMKKIEDFMEEGIDITFYDRFYDWEIATGSYLAKNTQYSIDLLSEFADYEFELPNSFHGTDNGALHIFLAEKLFPQALIQTNICKNVYKKSKNWADLFTYEACIRAIFGVGTDFGKVRIMKKGTGWVRDGWLTSMLWHSDLDFMLHGWKTGRLKEAPEGIIKPNQMGDRHWYNPLSGPIDLQKCGPQNKTWSYDTRLQGNKYEIVNSLRKYEEEVAIKQVHSYCRMKEIMSR